MSLCLIDVHGDIEGDFEWVIDLPRNATNGDMIKALFPDKNITIGNNIGEWWNSPFNHKGGSNDNNRNIN